MGWIKSWIFATWNGLFEPLQLMLKHRRLLGMLIRRDVAGRTSGTLLGMTWLFVQPALQMLGFWFLLDVIMQVRFPGKVPFIEYFLLGMLAWFFISEALMRSLSVFREFASIYQRTVFPLAILPMIPLLFAAFVYAVVNAFIAGFLHGFAAMPIAAFNIFVLVIWLLPACYILAIIGLFVKDLGQIFPFFITFVMYLTPILYQPSIMPESMQWLLAINPVADVMVLIHANVQGMEWAAENVWRPVLVWFLLLGPAWALFRRSEPHIREML
jgi:lipopolysaccharide transport system permease protein